MYGRTRSTTGALTALLVTALTAGTALAATMMLWEEVPSSAEFFVAECVLEPGAEEAVVWADQKTGRPDQGGLSGCDDVEFSVVFEDEEILVNGEFAGTYESHAVYEVVATAGVDGGGWIVDIHVMDVGTGELKALVVGEPMSGRPAKVAAEAGTVNSLDITVP